MQQKSTCSTLFHYLIDEVSYKWEHPQIIHVIFGFAIIIHKMTPQLWKPPNYGTPKSPFTIKTYIMLPKLP